MLALLISEHNALEKAAGAITRHRDMDELLKLFLSHTIDEERIMLDTGYSDYVKHRHAHDCVVNQLKDINLTIENYREVRYEASCILNDHIKNHDMILLNGLEMENESRDKTGNEGRA